MEKVKEVKCGYCVLAIISGFAIVITLVVIDYTIPTIIGAATGFITMISVFLLCWIVSDRIEKSRIKRKTEGIETFTPNQVMDKIEKALEMEKPSREEVLTYLYNLQANESLSNLEFFDIVGKTYQLSPKFFMFSIYPKIRRKIRTIYGDEGIRVMGKHILEKFCLEDGEQIVYELDGAIRLKVPKKYDWIMVGNLRQAATIYITNERIIAQGMLDVMPHESAVWVGITGGGTKDIKKARKAYIYNSAPCYGYNFPIKNLHGLSKGNRKLSYYSDENRVKITPTRKKDDGDKLFTILDEF